MNDVMLRGYRVATTRGLSGLSVQQFAAITNINKMTMYSWENAKQGGLTKKGATKLAKAFDTVGVVVSSDYLYNGKGLPPINIKLTSSAKVKALAQLIRETADE